MAREYNYTPKNEELFSIAETKEPEVCLGKTFSSADERREYYRNELRMYLKDPEFRAIDGFPIGDDEDIVALSDPPYYCACPNPWIPEFIKEWESQKTLTNTPYKREPFAADVSEGKNDPIYNAHTYHTKVPHKAIMRYVLHYTNPGDIVYDGFCGSGMTGVGAQLCNDKNEVESLGYSVDNNIIYEKNNNNEIKQIGELGVRHAILNDLSTAATFMSSNYNNEYFTSARLEKSKSLLSSLHKRFDKYYQTLHSDGKTIGTINYCIWSDVDLCPECGERFDYFSLIYDVSTMGIYTLKDYIICPKCGTKLSTQANIKKGIQKVEPIFETKYEEYLSQNIQIRRRVPVLINYSIGKKRFNKTPDENDLKLLDDIEKLKTASWFPTDLLPDGFNTAQPMLSHKIYHIFQFYEVRTLAVLASIYADIKDDSMLNFVFGSILPKLTILNRFMPQHGSRALVGPMANTLYVPPISTENNVINQLEFQLGKIQKALAKPRNKSVISTQGMQSLKGINNKIDYIFLDPPFGANINYSELNSIRESWLKVKTDNGPEAIENEVQHKGINEYYDLMKDCFATAYEALKPGHWMTVEFSNTKAEVWNSIQLALNNVGFIIASVSALDKQRGGLHAMIGPTSVKQDLVISLYKPDESFDRQITTAVGTEAVWTFVRKHLEYLPLTKEQGNATVTVPERDPRIIYDRMVSYFVGHNMLIPISAPDFLTEMPTRFVEREGLYYLQEQAQKYDKMVFNKQLAKVESEEELFVCDEKTAIAWIRKKLKEKTMTIGELTPLFMQELSNSWTKGEKKPELKELLEQNFLCYDGKYDVPSQVHSYLSTNYKELRNLSKDNLLLKEKGKGRWYIPDPSKAGDLEKIREKALLKEFSLYENSKGKIKEFRIEAIRAGFKKAWQDKNYTLIKSIAERMPNDIVEEDEKLLMWFSGALNRLGE